MFDLSVFNKHLAFCKFNLPLLTTTKKPVVLNSNYKKSTVLAAALREMSTKGWLFLRVRGKQDKTNLKGFFGFLIVFNTLCEYRKLFVV